MKPAVAVVGAFLLFPALAAAQQPCTTDARRVVDEVYQQVLERRADNGASGFVDQLASGRATVRDIVRDVAKSREHTQRFLSGNSAQAHQNAAAYLYRHLLGREPDAGGLQAHAAGIAGQGAGAAIDSMLSSAEYEQAFGDYAVPGSSGVRYCGPGQSSFRSDGQPSFRSDRQPANMRFRGMDSNRDGVITRAEWEGNTNASRRQDWNNDGVLSGDEVLPARGRAIRPDDEDRSSRFDEIDSNNNGRIDWNEWDGSADGFRWLDRDNNGVLTRGEVVGDTRNGDRFNNLDANRDGRLTFNEWPGTRRLFNQQDVNRDGVISRSEYDERPVGTSGR